MKEQRALWCSIAERSERRRVSGVEQQVKKMHERTGVYNFKGIAFDSFSFILIIMSTFRRALFCLFGTKLNFHPLEML